ncbi:MAG: hypothetical protein LHV69_03490 [Elusimicrobia bacterium]|nr:hypothetical protein [Candidatus Obscuribacterium magneticum]
MTDPAYDFGECWPENTVGGDHPDPYGGDFWSHFVPDRWGRYALYSNGGKSFGDPLGPGPGVWDIKDHHDEVVTFGGSSGRHHDWHGFTDWNVTSGHHHKPDDDYRGYYWSEMRVYAQKFDDKDSQIFVNSAHTRYENDLGQVYSTEVRPGQSPDGTKVAWHSEFLNGLNKTDIFWSVVFYPFTPTGLEARSGSGGIELRWLPPQIHQPPLD